MLSGTWVLKGESLKYVGPVTLDHRSLGHTGRLLVGHLRGVNLILENMEECFGKGMMGYELPSGRWRRPRVIELGVKSIKVQSRHQPQHAHVHGAVGRFSSHLDKIDRSRNGWACASNHF